MDVDDELAIKRLITDYMCWWDDRDQHQSYPDQLDEAAIWELWELKEDKYVLFRKFVGKNEMLAAKSLDPPIAHTTSNVVIKSIGKDDVEARAYFRTYRKQTGTLRCHGEGQYIVHRVNGSWKLMTIRNRYYWSEQD